MLKSVVVGAGTMGLGICYLLSKNKGYVTVIVKDLAKETDKRAFLERLAKKDEKRNNLTDGDTATDLMDRITFSDHYKSVNEAQFVIEAVSENIDVKLDIIKNIAIYSKDTTIVATNTSSLSITELASSYLYPEQIVGMHFFNPATIMQLVEVIKGFNTSQSAVDFVLNLAKDLGKSPIVVDEYPGFVVNRLLMPMINEAVNLLDCGVATLKGIDTAMRQGANHPIGPLELADLIGIDVVYAILDTLYAETGEHRYKPSYTLKKMCLANKLGRKSSQGFYTY
ncbi:3-hydroxyacyl-CoA dehydrogenase family protein [Shewanella sp. OMA3-2]|uniref:3-hydroxyacyl-CoA dehydrogenase family protein n=1 Tax=Shewanella sp. OMA3-2 TaxID=2908650 RepID=UPI001F3C113F|nr:3-hydroxyacyl-CoA dehydrogenase NAD-binding domain-containing protein [Shewanella sp. OMA3-2]UJF23140.1 3-hydroxyacyl-CoA dehydrogenase NAD-binding domain-containing protein [Shewanella sp. OMA3-2]